MSAHIFQQRAARAAKQEKRKECERLEMERKAAQERAIYMTTIEIPHDDLQQLLIDNLHLPTDTDHIVYIHFAPGGACTIKALRHKSTV